MQTQISRNNTLSVLLLLMFPVIILAMVWVFIYVLFYIQGTYTTASGETISTFDMALVWDEFLHVLPWVVGIVAVWFTIAYFFNASMVRHATGARPLTRMENMRVYNIVENLTMTCGMDMPQIFVVDDPQLNAYASGIDRKSYAVTLTTGLINLLDDNELAGVVGHELTHIRNLDKRLLITSIMSLTVRVMYGLLWSGGGRSRDNNNAGGAIIVLIIGLICSAIAYFFGLLTRFAISRKREYMADAGGAELCGDPLALASALRKISCDPGLGQVKRDDIAQLYIVHPQGIKQGFMSYFNSLFSTHPDTAKRIQILEQF